MNGLLFYFFWPAGLILGQNTTSKNFIHFCCLEVPKIAAVRTKRERGVRFFGRFFILRPLFPIANVNIFEIFFLIMVKVVFYHIRNAFVAKIYARFL